MENTLTEQIIQKLNDLPIIKKKAIFELLKEDSTTLKKYEKNFDEKWRNELLTTSVWTDSEIEEIIKAKEYINKWSHD